MGVWFLTEIEKDVIGTSWDESLVLDLVTVTYQSSNFHTKPEPNGDAQAL